MDVDKKLIVISAINFSEGGPLSILKDSLTYASNNLVDRFNVIALVHKKSLFDIPNINYLEFPKSKKSWIYRLFYEWIYFKKLSNRLNPYLWLSLHDVTPRVTTEIQAVYCHNPAPFYHLNLNMALIDIRFTLFNLFYSLLYRINIKNNDWIIVQQNWLRDEFLSRYPVNKVVVGYPSIKIDNIIRAEKSATRKNKKIFIFPTYPRIFKNIELVCEADKLLQKLVNCEYEIWITISGNENRYAKIIINNYSGNKIKFIGAQSRESIFDLYQKADCLIFPSKLETWGLPISEFKLFNKPILVANLPYAHETIGDYQYAKYFDANNPHQLARCMECMIREQLEYDAQEIPEPSQPFGRNWQQLFDIILNKNNNGLIL